MRLDDLGTRAGAELRDRFAHEYPPALPWELVASPVRRTYMSRFVMVLAGLMVVAVATTLTLVAVDARTPARSDRGGPMWQRISYDRAFGPNARIDRVVGGRRGYVASGRVIRPDNFDVAGETAAPTLWWSHDGSRWQRAKVPRPLAIFGLGEGRGRFLAAAKRSSRSYEIWMSTDGRRWGRTATLHTGGFGFDLGATKTGFFATSHLSGDSLLPRRVWSSPDGARWSVAAPQRGTVAGLVPQVRVRKGFGTVFNVPGPPSFAKGGPLFLSVDGLRWKPAPPSPGVLGVAGDQRRVVGVGSESGAMTGSVGVDRGHGFAEVHSFADRFPRQFPDHVVASGRWFVVGGHDGRPLNNPRVFGRAVAINIWVTPDLVHWSHLPSEFQGTEPDASGLSLAASGRSVVASVPGGQWIWIWQRPTRVPHLVRVSGTWRGVGGPEPGPVRPLPGRIEVRSAGKVVDSAETNSDGQYALDLVPGTYVLDGPCGSTTVRVAAQAIHRDVLCQMR